MRDFFFRSFPSDTILKAFNDKGEHLANVQLFGKYEGKIQIVFSEVFLQDFSSFYIKVDNTLISKDLCVEEKDIVKEVVYPIKN